MPFMRASASRLDLSRAVSRTDTVASLVMVAIQCKHSHTARDGSSGILVDMELGAHPPRALFSAPSRKTRTHGIIRKVRASVARKTLAPARPATLAAGV